MIWSIINQLPSTGRLFWRLCFNWPFRKTFITEFQGELELNLLFHLQTIDCSTIFFFFFQNILSCRLDSLSLCLQRFISWDHCEFSYRWSVLLMFKSVIATGYDKHLMKARKLANRWVVSKTKKIKLVLDNNYYCYYY